MQYVFNGQHPHQSTVQLEEHGNKSAAFYLYRRMEPGPSCIKELTTEPLMIFIVFYNISPLWIPEK